MKYQLLLVLSILTVCNCYAQKSNIMWQKSYGGSGNDEAYSVRQTFDGGYIVAGPSASFDGQVTGHHDTTNYDYWVVKLNDTGAIQWEKSLGGSMDDICHSVFQNSDSSYIVAGGIESRDGDVTGCSPLEYDYWIVKLSPSGGIVWNSCLGGSSYNVAWSIQQTSDLNYIVAGATQSTDSPVTGNHGSEDYWVVKLSSTGNLLWEKCYGGSGYDQGKSIQSTSDGGFIIAGSSNSNDGQVTGNHGGTDFWVVKTDDTGAIQWEKSLGGSGEDICYAVHQTFDGGYIVTGSSTSNDSEVTGNHGGADFWVVKLNDTGTIEWQKSLGGSADEMAYSIEQTSDSGYVVAGSTSSSIGGQITQSFGNDDYWVVKLSKYGNIQWQKSLGGSASEDAYSVHQTTDSGFVVAGGSNSNDSEVSGNHGNYDYWVVKLSKCVLDSPVILRSGNTLSLSTTLSAYQWNLNNIQIPGATNATFTIIDSGSYTVNIIDSNGCVGTSKPLTGMKESVDNVVYNYSITAFPNPTTDLLFVTGAEKVNISIYNAIGQLLKEAAKTNQISISELPNGFYIAKINNEQGLVEEIKVLKQ